MSIFYIKSYKSKFIYIFLIAIALNMRKNFNIPKFIFLEIKFMFLIRRKRILNYKFILYIETHIFNNNTLILQYHSC